MPTTKTTKNSTTQSTIDPTTNPGNPPVAATPPAASTATPTALPSRPTASTAPPPASPSPPTASASPPAASASPASTDPNAALSALVQQAITQLNAIGAALGSDPPLAGSAKRRVARMRKGGTKILAVIADLATRHGLESSAMQVAPMMVQAGAASALQPLVNALVMLGTRANNLAFTAQSNAWEIGLQFYAVLQRRAASDTALAAALAPVTQFFAFRHKSADASGGPTKPQRKATKKALTTLKKTAPELLAPATPAGATAPASPGSAAAVGSATGAGAQVAPAVVAAPAAGATTKA